MYLIISFNIVIISFQFKVGKKEEKEVIVDTLRQEYLDTLDKEKR